MEVEAVEEGKIGKILVAEGTDGVPVNQVIAVLLEEGEDASAITETPAAPAPKAAEAPQEQPKQETKPAAGGNGAEPPPPKAETPQPAGPPAPSAAEGPILATALRRPLSPDTEKGK